MGDPDFVKMDVDRFIGTRSSLRIRAHFNPQKTYEAGHYGAKTHLGNDDGTSHLSVVDSNGNAISLTTTINTGFGSRFVGGRTGVIMNNQMDDFVTRPGRPNSFGLIGEKANAVAPKKRPLSSMMPTILSKNGKIAMVIGASGGPMIISSVIQVMLNILAFGMSPSEAVSAPRIHHQWVPETLSIEPGISEPALADLQNMGHVLTRLRRYSATQVIFEGTRGYFGAADTSKGGGVAGLPFTNTAP